MHQAFILFSTNQVTTEKDIYSVSYTKFMSKRPNLFVLSDYNLTEIHKKHLEANNQYKWSDFREGFLNSSVLPNAEEPNVNMMTASV